MKWVVVSVGAEGHAERTRTHTVRLTLTPRDAERGDVKVKDTAGAPASRPQ
jgi:hypothetical protein